MEEPSISKLPDDLILKIFSFLPLYKESVATHLLTKFRMEGPWKLMSDVMFDDDDDDDDEEESYEIFVRFMSFVYGSLLFNNNQILESIHLNLSGYYSASDIDIWVKLAVNRSVRKLRIMMLGKPLELPSCLSTCVTLKSLILKQVSIKVVPSSFRLLSLKSLHLFSVKFIGLDDSLARLLQSCPDLEYLVVRNVMFYTVPHWLHLSSLKSLHLLSSSFWGNHSVASLLSICPVLEDLVVNKTHQVFSNNVPTSITCETLKTLILRDLSINHVPTSLCMPSLKTMHLLSVAFSGDISAANLLQQCPHLEDLVVKQTKVFARKSSPLISCETLNTLTLSELSTKVDLPWFWFGLPSLKNLHLLSVKFSGTKTLASFVRMFPVLECLVINKTRDDNVRISIINSRSLRSLSIDNSIGERAYVDGNHGFVIDAPSLEKMNFKDTFSNFLVFEHMPKVTEANIQVICSQSNNFIGSLTSIRHLSLCCLSSETPYPSGTTFPYLEHVELCTCSAGWANLLVCLLNDAPRLKHLKLKSQHGAHDNDPMILWEEPTSVPECLSTYLEIMEWRQYEGTEQERNVAAYILANAACLKMATFSTRGRNKHHRMLENLKKLNRVSQTCQLLFD